MLLETLEVMRDLPRLQEIAAILIRYGWGDVVRMLGIGSMLERAGRLLHWQPKNNVTHLDLPVRLRLAMEELGPTFVKLGQVMATRVDLFHPSWIDEFEKLQNRVPPVPFPRIKPELEQALGRPFTEAFSEFDETPFASASIAQVHRARLHDGSPAVVKIRRPGIVQKIEADLRILRHLTSLLELEMPEFRRYLPTQIIAQFGRSLHRELDFVREARNVDQFRTSFEGSETVVIPKVYWEWTRDSVCVQEELHGVIGVDHEQLEHAGLDPVVLADRGADAVLKMILEDGYFHADPHPGNVIFMTGNRLGMIDFGMVGRLTEHRRTEIVELLDALVRKDEQDMINILLLWAGNVEVDEEKLAADMSEMVYGYDNLRLKDIKLGPLLADITAITRDNRLTLPTDLTLLFKALISLEGLGHQLNPDFHLLDHMAPYVSSLVLERYQPSQIIARGRRELRHLLAALTGLPRGVTRLVRSMRRGGVKIDLDLKRLDHFGHQLDKASNRLTMGILTASLVIGSSIIMTVEGGPTLLGLPLFGLVGFLIAFANSIWLLFSIWRTNKE
jgi:ubiquinone biosynthesis protein